MSRRVAALVLLSLGLLAASYLVTSTRRARIRVGTILGGISTLDVMTEGGLIDSPDLVDVVYFDKTLDLAHALSSGEVDVAAIPVEMAAKLRQGGAAVVVVAVDMFQNQAILVRDGLEVDSPADLANRTVGVFTPTGTYAMFRAYMRKVYGLSPAEDMVLVNKPPSSLVQAFSSGELDAVVLWEPLASKALESGGRILANFSDLWSEWGGTGRPVMIVYAANEKFAKTHPDLLAEFLRLRDEAARRWNSDGDAILDILVGKYGLTRSGAESAYGRVSIWEGPLTDELVQSSMEVLRLAWRGGYLPEDPEGLRETLFWRG